MQNQAISGARRLKAGVDGVSFDAGGWLALAATPTFAAMALLTALGGEAPGLLCGVAADTFPLAGMAPMYGLMSVFHLLPWLRLAGRRRRTADRRRHRRIPTWLSLPPCLGGALPDHRPIDRFIA